MPQPAPIPKPKALIYQEFQATPAVITQPFRAHISGPAGYLVRYKVAAEKENGNLGGYDPLAIHAFNWPLRPAGALVDQAYTKVRIDAARLQTFSDLIGAGDVVAPVSGKLDQIRIADATYGFKANGSGYPRFPALFERDVAVGDKVHLRGVAAGTPYLLDTYVRGFAADQVAAVIGAASAGPNNQTTQALSTTVTQVAGAVNCNVLTALASGYNALVDGAVNDVYTLTVTSSASNGSLHTAILRLTSASGFDDQLVVVPGDVDNYFAVGVRGLQLRFSCGGHTLSSISTDNLVVGQTWTIAVHENYAAPAATSAGTYSGTATATYIATCTKGGLFGAADPTTRPQLTFTTTSGVDNSGPVTINTTGTAYPVGTQGVTIQFAAGPQGIRKGDVWYITATAAANGRFGTLILGRSLPAALAAGATDLDLVISLERNLCIPADRYGFEPILNWTQSATQISINDSILGYDPAVTLAGVQQPLPITAGTVYVEYRAWIIDLCGVIASVTAATLDSVIPGANHPDNPLKYAASKALANSNGVEVKVTGVCNPDDDNSWADVLSLLAGTESIYGLVPLTTRQTVLNLYLGHVKSESSPENGRWRAMWSSLTVIPTVAVVSAASTTDHGLALATIGVNPLATGTQYTYLQVAAANANFLTSGVIPGDVVRYNYGTSWGQSSWTEYVIDAVINEDTIRLVAGPVAAVTIARKVEIWRNLKKDDQVAAIGATAAAFGSFRNCAIWPDIVGSGGLNVPGYHLCAALAGLRSGVVPHQGLTEAAVVGFDDLSRTNYFNGTQLDQLAGYGVWIVGQDTSTLQIVNRHAITTDVSDIIHREEMVRVNLDSISYIFRRWFSAFVGKANVSDDLVKRFQVEIDAIRDYLRNNNRFDGIGAQADDLINVSVTRHPYLADRIVVTVTPVLPIPLNYPEVHIVI